MWDKQRKRLKTAGPHCKLASISELGASLWTYLTKSSIISTFPLSVANASSISIVIIRKIRSMYRELVRRHLAAARICIFLVIARNNAVPPAPVCDYWTLSLQPNIPSVPSRLRNDTALDVPKRTPNAAGNGECNVSTQRTHDYQSRMPVVHVEHFRRYHTSCSHFSIIHIYFIFIFFCCCCCCAYCWGKITHTKPSTVKRYAYTDTRSSAIIFLRVLYEITRPIVAAEKWFVSVKFGAIAKVKLRGGQRMNEDCTCSGSLWYLLQNEQH